MSGFGDIHRTGLIASQQVGQPHVVVESQDPVQRRLAQIRVDQQHSLAGLGELNRQTDHRGALAFAGRGAGHGQQPGHPTRGRKLQGGAQRTIGFGERRTGIVVPGDGDGALVAALSPDQGNQAQHGQPQQLFDFVHLFEGSVVVLQQECQTDTTQQANHQRQQRVELQIGLVGPDRRLGFVHHRNIVGADTGRHPNLLVALQQAVIQLAVGVDLATQDIELDAAALQFQHVPFELVEIGPQQRFLGPGRLVGGGYRAADIGHLLIDLSVNLVDLAAELHHERIGRFIGVQIVLILSLQLRLGFLERFDDLAVQHLAQPLTSGAQHLPIGRLGGGSLLFRRRQRGIDGGQFLGHDVLAFVDVDDALLAGEGDHFPFRVLQPGLDLLQAFLQEVARIGGGVKTTFQVQVDIGLGQGIENGRGQFGFGAVEPQFDQPRVAYRRDGQVLQEGRDDRFPARRLGLWFFLLRSRDLRQPIDQPFSGLGQQREPVGPEFLVNQIELVNHSLRQVAAFEQFVLGLIVVQAGTCRRFIRRHPLDLDDPDVLAIDLQGQTGAVDGRH